MTFSWNGSHLGTLTSKNLLSEESIYIGAKLRCWQVSWKGVEDFLIVKSVKNELPAILDELKPIFSLPQVGCHTFRYRGNLMIGYRPYIVDNYIYAEATLHDYDGDLDADLVEQVQKTLAFREIFGVTKTTEKSLLLRYENPAEPEGIPTIISCFEPGCSEKPTSILSQRLLNKWFSTRTPKELLTEAVKNLLFLNYQQLETTLDYYRPRVEEVINRINPNLIGYADIFFDRLNQFLPY